MKRKRGRPPKGSALVEKFAGSESAKEKLKVIVATLTGELSVEEACGHLGVSEQRLHQMRDEVLSAGLWSLEPKPVGRPREEETEEERKVRELQARVDRLELELHAADARTMIALTMPHLLKDWRGKKN
jgi:transposase-like protein